MGTKCIFYTEGVGGPKLFLEIQLVMMVSEHLVPGAPGFKV